jgi:hypothetical protein
LVELWGLGGIVRLAGLGVLDRRGDRVVEHGFVDVTPSYKGHRFPVEIISHWCVQQEGRLIM